MATITGKTHPSMIVVAIKRNGFGIDFTTEQEVIADSNGNFAFTVDDPDAKYIILSVSNMTSRNTLVYDWVTPKP